jgi:hypothetical protein
VEVTSAVLEDPSGEIEPDTDSGFTGGAATVLLEDLLHLGGIDTWSVTLYLDSGHAGPDGNRSQDDGGLPWSIAMSIVQQIFQHLIDACWISPTLT